MKPAMGAATIATILLLAAPARSALTCAVSADTVSFGTYNGVVKTQVTTMSTITQACTGSGSATYTITLSPGRSGTATARYMASGSSHLSYQIYKDAARTQIFGDGTGGTYTFSNTTGAESRSGTLYSVIPAGQSPAPGSYSDTLTVQVTY